MSAGIRSDSEKAIREWLARLGVTTLYIEPGSPWDNGYVESLIGKFRDELLNGENLLHPDRGQKRSATRLEGSRGGYSRRLSQATSRPGNGYSPVGCLDCMAGALNLSTRARSGRGGMVVSGW